MKKQLLLSIFIAFKAASLIAQCNPDLSTGLIAAWDFNGNAKDLSVNGHDGTVHNATLTTDRCGKANSAYMFHRTGADSSYIKVLNSPDLNLVNTDYTIAYWVWEPDSTVRGGYAIVKRSGTTLTQGYHTGTNAASHKLGFVIAGGSPGAFNLFSNSSVESGTWTHLAITYSFSNKIMKMYINGVFDKDSMNVPSPSATNTSVVFGRDFINPNAPAFEGKIDDISMYNRELDDCSISALFNKSCTVLPISLLSFNGFVKSNTVLLNWQTAQEINTDYFVIEKSFDSRDFTMMSQIKAAGNSSDIRSYQTTDEFPQKGSNYYRIKTVDINGSASYSKSILLNVNLKEVSLMAYPNPVKNNLSVKFYAEAQQKVQMRIIDAQGKVVQKLSYEVKSGTTLISLNTSSLAKGLYQIVLNGQENGSARFIKE